MSTKIDQINNSNMQAIKKALSDKGIAFNSKAKKSDLQDTVNSHAKQFYMGIHSGSYYFSTKKNTHAGRVCRLIALSEVNSTSDIRKKYTAKYSFKQTLARLSSENIITFTNTKKSEFVLSDKGIALAKKYIQIYESA